MNVALEMAVPLVVRRPLPTLLCGIGGHLKCIFYVSIHSDGFIFCQDLKAWVRA